MLDDINVLNQRDPADALGVASKQYAQADYEAIVWSGDNDGRAITSIVVAGMGGSALAALLAQTWLRSELTIPFEVVRGYSLPHYVDHHTLVIASSYSGNTEETVSCVEEAERAGAQIGVVSSGGKLIDLAVADSIAHVQLPDGLQPRMAVIYNLRALVALLVNFEIIPGTYQADIAKLSPWLQQESTQWSRDVTTDSNYAKQLALAAVGKTAIVYGGELTWPAAYKWKISWNENAKNVAFWNQYPEFNHNEFMGWTSHPVDKPFVVFDLESHLELPKIQQRFDVSDRLLSGFRPKAITVNLQGETVLAQLLWASILGDFISIYLAMLNGVDPTPVELIESLKHELAV